jgi:hypothetical protein
MRNLLGLLYEKLIEKPALKLTFHMLRDLNERQVELCKILNKHLPKDKFVPYCMIVDIIKTYAPNLYEDFGKKFPLRYISITLLDDLEKLWYGNYLERAIITHPEFGNITDGYKLGWKKPMTKEEFIESVKTKAREQNG